MKTGVAISIILGIIVVTAEARERPGAEPRRLAGSGAGNERAIEELYDPGTCPTTPISCGQTRLIEMRAGDCKNRLGAYVDLVRFHGTAGQTVTITLDMLGGIPNPYIALFPPYGNQSVANALSQQYSTRVSLTHTLDATGEWFILSTALDDRMTTVGGSANLTLMCGVSSGDPCHQILELSCGLTTSGGLSSSDCRIDGYNQDRYLVRLDANETFDLRATASFPLWLDLGEPGDRAGIYVGGTNEESISYTAPRAQELILIVSSWTAGATGTYMLDPQCGSVAPCRRRGVRPVP
jgi:hypothetical protein